jgi:hypothetical protein
MVHLKKTKTKSNWNHLTYFLNQCSPTWEVSQVSKQSQLDNLDHEQLPLREFYSVDFKFWCAFDATTGLVIVTLSSLPLSVA